MSEEVLSCTLIMTSLEKICDEFSTLIGYRRAVNIFERLKVYVHLHHAPLPIF